MVSKPPRIPYFYQSVINAYISIIIVANPVISCPVKINQQNLF